MNDVVTELLLNKLKNSKDSLNLLDDESFEKFLKNKKIIDKK